ncbi:MAG: hypothetical protein MRERC_1c180 [Mycoplasmataceae bacterium RC_NB112A]|nr:MAG: hypothetical protein MRERC_1c180 [Mycoplasmataceae bacterium RC_NB112A]
MLFLIIFLTEYAVYKKNDLPGLIMLNILFLFCYWYKEQIMEYADSWSNYLLIIGYVTGNVLAYNSVDIPNYKMAMVYEFNAIVALVYAYTYWQRLGGKQLAEKTYQQSVEKLRSEFNVDKKNEKKFRLLLLLLIIEPKKHFRPLAKVLIIFTRIIYLLCFLESQFIGFLNIEFFNLLSISSILGIYSTFFFR